MPTPPRSDPTPAADAEPTSGGEKLPLAERISFELDLLGRNIVILDQLGRGGPMGIIRLSEILHIPVHKVRYSLHLLEREGVIQPSADGAVLTERAKEYGESLSRSLENMTRLITQLRERGTEFGRRMQESAGKGY